MMSDRVKCRAVSRVVLLVFVAAFLFSSSRGDIWDF